MPDRTEKYDVKLSSNEMLDFYRDMHCREIARDARDELAPVISGGEFPAVNKVIDLGHRQGMRRAFRYLNGAIGSLQGVEVLDLGCGRGRWVKQYGSKGAHVTGADISEAAVAMLKQQFPAHDFVAGDIATLEFPASTFDIVNSVTVVQHLPEDRQKLVFQRAYRWIKPGGWLVMLENTAHFHGDHVFAHTKEQWIDLAVAEGFRFCAAWPSNFEAGLQVIDRFRRRKSTAAVVPAAASVPSIRRTWKSSLRRSLLIAAAYVSYPLEPVLGTFPVISPTHQAMIFRK